jgi:hypothetical protein
MKRLAALLLVAMVAAAAGLAAPAKPVSFTWAFIRQTADGGAAAIDASALVSIKAGDLFKIYIQPDAGTFVYVILQDASNDVQTLFPDSFELFDAAAYAAARYYIPDGNDWFTLDAARGTERVILVASSERLVVLESLLRANQKAAADKKSTVAAINAARQAVLDEVKKLAREHSQLAAAAEKPVTIAGGTRGINETAAKLAVHIGAAGFYTRTFRLEH